MIKFNISTIRVISKFSQWAVAIGMLALPACGSEAPVDTAEAKATDPQPLKNDSNAVIVTWNEHAAESLKTHDGYPDPLPASRLFAMVHVAMHDAVSNTASRRYAAYATHSLDTWAHPVAAAASAAYHVLVQQFPLQQATLQHWLDESLAAVPDGASESRGIALGELAAQSIIDLRAEDGSSIVLPYTPGTAPGDYQYTMDQFIASPGWQKVALWSLERADQFRPSAPPPLASRAYARAYQEVKSKGKSDSATRSADETNYAKFWFEFSESGWNRVARVVATQERLGLAKTARLFALVNMALADSYIAGWDAKFFYDTWRPITAIRAGNTDGNPATTADNTWEPLMTTPPVQDYPSTHSVLGDAAAEVLTRILRRDSVRFEMGSTSFEGTRKWNSFSEAANENADSRVMAGIHFRFASRAGQRMGRQIGRQVVETQLPQLD